MDVTQFIASRREVLLISDYNSYRAQLSRQIRAARKRLGRATNKREKFAAKPVTAEDVGSNHEFVHLLLLTAERAWAHAMHIKTTYTEDVSGKGITGTTRTHLISRLTKAAKSAQSLVDVLRDSCAKAAEQDVLEAQAYQNSLAGSEEFEKHTGGSKPPDQLEKGWQACLRHYSIARVIYAALLEKEKKEVYRLILADTIDPTIRYAAYQARLSRTIAISAVAKRYFPKDDPQLVSAVERFDAYALKDKPAPENVNEKAVAVQEIPTSVTWRGRKANIVDASIGQALANVATAEAKLRAYLSSNPAASTRDKATAYDEVLDASQDAANAAKRATDELEKERIDEGDARMQDLRVTSLSVSCDLVSWRVGRYRTLIGQDDGMTLEAQALRRTKRSRKDDSQVLDKEESRGRRLARLKERLVLYDAIVQSIASIKDLRGALRNEQFVAELDGKMAYFRALKCLNISHSHSLLDNSLNALALLKRAQDLVSEPLVASAKHDDKAPPTLDVSSTEYGALQNHIRALTARTHAIVEMRTLESNSAIAAQKNLVSSAPLVQRLNDFPTPGIQVDLQNLVSYPPKIEPIPVKPLFLDVAFNYIEYPGRKAESLVAEQKPFVKGALQENHAQQEQPQQQQQKRGWFSFGRA